MATTPQNTPKDWPLGERQSKLTIHHDDNADYVAKLRYVADQIEAGNVNMIIEHPPWMAFKGNCCGGSPP